MPRVKLLATVAACAAVAISAAAYAASTAAPTFLTIKGPNGDFHGKVDSPKLHRCVDGRLVNVFKQKGSEQQPKTDQQIGADTAEIQDDHGVWSIGNSGFKKGRFYARAPRKPGCRTGKSKTITIGPTLAPTTVTIEGENGDYHGTVDSPKLNACVDQRTITVYKQAGESQSPATDDQIGMDNAEVEGDHGVWSIGNSGFKTGNFYARASKTSLCRAGSSPTIER
jgi:hypothetical protein